MPSVATEDVLQRKPRNIAVNTNPEHGLHLVQSDVPEPGRNECLVHVRATGICGSDVHFWKHGRIGDMVVVGENGLGHESAGVVIITRFKPGALPPYLLCLLEYHLLLTRLSRRQSGTRVRDSVLFTNVLLLPDWPL